jgi:outer membrane protein assembly factor BamB
VASPLLHNSHGSRPTEVFEDFFPDGVVAIDFAREARTLLIGTKSGHVCLMNQNGDRLVEDRGFAGLRKLVWSDNGNIGVAVLGENRLVCFDARLKPLWDASITGRIISIAIAPYGSHVAFSSDSARLHIVTADRKEIAKVETRRAMEHLTFLTEAPELIGAAEFGQLCRFDLTGKEIWNERLMNNAGDMSVSEGGKRIFLAAFNHGVQVYDRKGIQLGSFAIDGIPGRVSASATKDRVAVMTLENRIFWLNFEGTIQWAVDISQDPPAHICTGPLGDRLFIATQSGCVLHVAWP